MLEKEKPKRKRRSALNVVAAATSGDDSIIIAEPMLKQIGKIADQLNVEIYIVGGYVRDYYLKKKRTDFDFTVVGDALEFAKEIANRFKSKAVTYPKFRTAMVPIGKYKFEFVGTRKEEYKSNSRKPIVTIGTLEDDLRRRDFTINAIAVSLNKENFGKVIDKFNGLTDIRSKILKTPLDPPTTFTDDPLRMLRAIRFASQLGFLIHQACYFAIKRLASRIEIISQERITDEFLKILDSPKPSHGLYMLYDTGLMKLIFPELAALAGVEEKNIDGRVFKHKDVLLHTFQVVDNLATQTDNIWLKFAALMHDIAKPVTKRFNENTGWTFHGHEELGARHVERVFRRMRLPLDKVEYVEKLVRLHQRPMALVDEGVTDSAVRRLAFHAGDALEDLFMLCKADITTNNPRLSFKYFQNYDRVFQKVQSVQEKDKLREFQSPVRGDEIMEITGLPPSRVIGQLKTRIEDAILDGKIPNEYEAAKEYFIKNKDKWLIDLLPPVIEDDDDEDENIEKNEKD
jgi:tRNA nucleotidyltransferase/poly(A) polymerase